MAGAAVVTVSGRVYLRIMDRFSEGVEPLHQLDFAFPAWWFAGPEGRIYLFQSPAFRFKISSCVDVGGVETCMSKPAANHRHVHCCRDKTNCCGVAKRMRGNSFVVQ